MENFNYHLRKTTIVLIIVLTIVFGSIPFVIFEVNKIKTEASSSKILIIDPYPGLTWTKPKQSTFDVLFNEGTDKETIISALGEESTAEFNSNISKEISVYYQKELSKKGFEKIKSVNNPEKDKYWVEGFEKDNTYFEVQYYTTPYKNTHTCLVFFGNLVED